MLLNAASYVLAFVLMLGVAGGGRVAAGETRAGGANRGWWVAFADRGYRWLIVVIFCYALAETTLNVAMPVYFVDTLDLPGWVPGTVFVINTVMIGVGQGLVVRSMTGIARRRVLLAAVGFSAVSFVLLYAAGALSVTTGVVVVLVGAVVFTLGEMTAGPVVAALSAEAPPPEQRGRFMAATQLAWGASGAVGPLLFAFLLHRGALWLWGGALALCAGLGADGAGDGAADAAGPRRGHQRRRERGRRPGGRGADHPLRRALLRPDDLAEAPYLPCVR